jgi:hypothetical protein
LECGGFGRLTFGNERDGLTVDPTASSDLPDPNFDDSSSDFVAGDHFALSVFRASEIYHAQVVALLPTTRGFFPDVAMLIRNDVAPPQQSSQHHSLPRLSPVTESIV